MPACACLGAKQLLQQDRKSTRLNSSHSQISDAVFCLKKKEVLIAGVGPGRHVVRRAGGGVVDRVEALPPQARDLVVTADAGAQPGVFELPDYDLRHGI